MNAAAAFVGVVFTRILPPPQAYGLGAFGLNPISNTTPCMLARVTALYYNLLQ